MSHANAPLTPTGRLRLARCVVEDGWPLRRAAERFGVSVTTARRWAERYRAEGEAGMVDRSSRPRRCTARPTSGRRSEEHTSELQSRGHLVCRLLLEKKKKTTYRSQATLSK